MLRIDLVHLQLFCSLRREKLQDFRCCCSCCLCFWVASFIHLLIVAAVIVTMCDCSGGSGLEQQEKQQKANDLRVDSVFIFNGCRGERKTFSFIFFPIHLYLYNFNCWWLCFFCVAWRENNNNNNNYIIKFELNKTTAITNFIQKQINWRQKSKAQRKSSVYTNNNTENIKDVEISKSTANKKNNRKKATTTTTTQTKRTRTN